MVDFKKTLLTLPDDEFFELIRNYLGPIKTPFNKHDLIAKLIAFLHRDEIQDRIIGLIDESDAEILTAIWILDEPTHEDLFAFMASDHSFLELHNHILNLEDRLLIYRDGDLIRLNPELRPQIEAGIVHPSRLFHGRAAPAGKDAGAANGAASWVDDNLLISFFSYLIAEPGLYKADGSLRKRSADSLARRIPVLTERVSGPGEPERLKIDFLTAALLGLGLAVEEGFGIRPVVHVWRRWARIPRLTRLAEIAGAAATTAEGERSDTISAARAVVTSMPEGLQLESGSVARLAAAATGVPSEAAAKAVLSLTLMGLLHPVDGTLCRAWAAEDTPETKPLVVQANFELTVPVETAFTDALFVAEVGELIRHDTYARFELTKERVASAMRGGMGGAHIADRLTELADGVLPGNVAISIRAWEDEYESIRLFRGVVLQVHESRRYAVDHSETIKGLIVQELAPGVYLVDPADVKDLQQALKEAGVELIPELPPADPEGFVAWVDSNTLPDAGARTSRLATLIQESLSQKPAKLREARGIQDALGEALGAKSFPADQRQELTERIDRKLIVTENQLTSGALKSEKTEAKGLDFAGKVRIIEQSLRSGEYLEVIERTPDGTPRRRLLEPVALGKDGTELILTGSELPGREEVKLQVGKLGLVRRLRAALFKRSNSR